MLCKYRNILHVYSGNWQPVHPIKGIRFPESRRRDTTSLKYRGYAMFILELTREWMENIEYVIDNHNLENKLA